MSDGSPPLRPAQLRRSSHALFTAIVRGQVNTPAQPAIVRSNAQLKLLALYGALQGVEWLVVEAQCAVAGPAPMGDPQLHPYLLKLQMGLARAQGHCLNHACPVVGTEQWNES